MVQSKTVFFAEQMQYVRSYCQNHFVQMLFHTTKGTLPPVPKLIAIVSNFCYTSVHPLTLRRRYKEICKRKVRADRTREHHFRKIWSTIQQ